MSSLIAPHFAAKDSPESLAAESLLAVRRLFISLPQPPGPICDAFRAARSALKAWLYWHGCAVVAAGRLWFIDDADQLDDIPQPASENRMRRDNPGVTKAKTTTPKPPAEKPAPYYTPPVVVREGDLATSARMVDGTPTWSVGVLGKILGPRCVQAATARARDATPLDSHNRLFPKLRSRINGKTAPVSCVSLEGLRVLAKYVPQNGKAGKALASYLESAG